MKQLHWLPVMILTVAACGPTERGEPPREHALLQAQAASEELNLELAALQRALAVALPAHDTVTLRRLLGPEFRVTDTRTPQPNPLSPGSPVQPREISYIEVLAGAMMNRFEVEYHTFGTVIAGSDTLAYALAKDDVLRTRWRRGPDGWYASHLVIMHSEGARKELWGHP
jgi:hypothetical protein